MKLLHTAFSNRGSCLIVDEEGFTVAKARRKPCLVNTGPNGFKLAGYTYTATLERGGVRLVGKPKGDTVRLGPVEKMSALLERVAQSLPVKP